jgi:hypothetical protein
MYTKQSFIVIILLVAIISAMLFSFLVTTTNTIIPLLPPYNNNIITTIIFQQPSSSNLIEDSIEDVKLISIYSTKILPVVRDYHDIISASVNKIDDGNKMILTMDLAGDVNKNEKYETVYLWLIYYTSNLHGRNQQQQFYTVIIPNFPSDSNFENKNGWYLTIFNNTDSSYTLPLSKISGMPKNKVQVFFDPAFIGNPQSFNYIVSTMVRVNSTYLNKPPDYLVDSAPDGNELFWVKWFS